MKAKVADDGKATSTDRRLLMENGHPGVEVDEAAIRRGENPYTKYYQQQGEHSLPGGTQVSSVPPSNVYDGIHADGMWKASATTLPVRPKISRAVASRSIQTAQYYQFD